METDRIFPNSTNHTCITYTIGYKLQPCVNRACTVRGNAELMHMVTTTNKNKRTFFMIFPLSISNI